MGLTCSIAFLMGEHKVLSLYKWADIGRIYVGVRADGCKILALIDLGLMLGNSPLPSSVPSVYDLSAMYSVRCILRCWKDLRYRCQSDSCLRRSPSRPAKASVP
jgi:hypothetical protein